MTVSARAGTAASAAMVWHAAMAARNRFILNTPSGTS
jgi:hypothetical protein